MNIQNGTRNNLRLSSHILLWLIAVGFTCLAVDRSWAKGEAYPTTFNSPQHILLASRAVEGAWEEFHQSAIEGTLASPVVQTQIEQELHEARGLLMEARKANRKGDHQSVMNITNRVIDLSKIIVTSSRERKQ